MSQTAENDQHSSSQRLDTHFRLPLAITVHSPHIALPLLPGALPFSLVLSHAHLLLSLGFLSPLTEAALLTLLNQAINQV